jgi:hypothetical protein
MEADMAGIGAIDPAGFGDQAQPVQQPDDQGEFDRNLHTAQLTGQTAQVHLAQAQLDEPGGQQPRPLERPRPGTGVVIRPNIPHWNGPPLQEMAHQRGFLVNGRAIGGGLAAAGGIAREIGLNALMNRDVGRLARETGIVLDTESNPYHRAIAQEYTENLGTSELSRLYRAPMTREQALEVVQYRLAELAVHQPAPGNDAAAQQPAPEGTVRLQIGAVTHTMASDSVQPDPTCHPNGFWAPDPSYPNTLARLPAAAHYQDQINGGRIGLNYYIPRGSDTLETGGRTGLDVQSYDGCISPETAYTGAPIVTAPTLVDAKHGYGSFFQMAEREGFLDLSQYSQEARSQGLYSGGVSVQWYASDPSAVPYFAGALAGTGASVLHEPLR